jgi:hypothetical protein
LVTEGCANFGVTRQRSRVEFFVNNFSRQHTKRAKILIVQRQAERLQWLL